MLKATLDQLLLDFLYEKRDCRTDFFNGMGVDQAFVTFAGLKGLTLDVNKDERRFRETFWRLAAQGLVVQGTSASGGQAKLPHVQITEYGIKCYEEGRILPYDPKGYVAALKDRAGAIDPVVELYVEEALGCFWTRNYLASAVMVGGALEKLVNDLTDAFEARLQETERGEYQRAVLAQKKVKTRLEKFLVFIEAHGYKHKLTLPLKEKLEGSFPAIANIIRITRNEVGHPVGRVVDGEEAEAYLLLAKEAIIFAAELLAAL